MIRASRDTSNLKLLPIFRLGPNPDKPVDLIGQIRDSQWQDAVRYFRALVLSDLLAQFRGSQVFVAQLER